MRLGFDLHDGPIQDVLALAADVRLLQEQVYPFVLERHRAQAVGRFDDLTARLVELDRDLREIAHSLETKSVISRPLGEILHREIDTFAEAHGHPGEPRDPWRGRLAHLCTADHRLSRDPGGAREHPRARGRHARLRARPRAQERDRVQITDDGMGFEVERALAKAAQRGRLGLVGIAERTRMLGGTFDLDSAIGGPTTLRLTLPAGSRSYRRRALTGSGMNDEEASSASSSLPLCRDLPTPQAGYFFFACSFAYLETHLPNAFRLFAFVP
jgi:signal transduction histidine kinase